MKEAGAISSDREWLTSMEEIAIACGDKADEYGIRRAYRACANGDIPAIKVAGRWRVRRAALEAHFAKLEQRAVAG